MQKKIQGESLGGHLRSFAQRNVVRLPSGAEFTGPPCTSLDHLLGEASPSAISFVMQNSPFALQSRAGHTLHIGYDYAHLVELRKRADADARKDAVIAYARKVQDAHATGGDFWIEFCRRITAMRLAYASQSTQVSPAEHR